MTAFCTESFPRLGYLVALEQKRTRKQRREGFDPVTASRLERFEDPPFESKVSLLAAELGCRKPDRAVLAAATNLIKYRNDCVHDTPVLWLGPKVVHKVKRGGKGKASNVEPGIGDFERLSMANRPARLKHVVKAVQAHDGIVQHFYSVGPAGWRDDMKHFDVGIGDGRLSDSLVRDIPWSLVKDIAKAWERHGEEMANVAPDEMLDTVLDLERKSKVKRV